MDVWGWIAVYAVGLTLLQLLVYRYLLNSGRSLTQRVGSPFGDESDRDTSWVDGSSNPTSNSNSSRSSGDHDHRGGRDSPPSVRGLETWPQAPASVTHPSSTDPSATDGRPCRHCGVVNELDTTFTRCWNCTREL